MAWSTRDNSPIQQHLQRTETPDGLWRKCDPCGEITLLADFKAHQNVCPQCHFHFPYSASDRIARFLDPGSFVEEDVNLRSKDPLNFTDTKPYRVRLDSYYKKTGRRDAIIVGHGRLYDKEVEFGVFDFEFMGGSMGIVVGEKISRLFKRAAEFKRPAILVTSSGGARMQEGILSLMQMAKTCAALTIVKEAGVPFISILTNPTTGGVAASFAMLGDVNIGEPGALIGFAGPRVIRQTIGEELPEGFQRSEYLLEHGMLDMIVHREALRPKVAKILDILYFNKES